MISGLCGGKPGFSFKLTWETRTDAVQEFHGVNQATACRPTAADKTPALKEATLAMNAAFKCFVKIFSLHGQNQVLAKTLIQHNK